jgi:hypothetical protein
LAHGDLVRVLQAQGGVAVLERNSLSVGALLLLARPLAVLRDTPAPDPTAPLIGLENDCCFVQPEKFGEFDEGIYQRRICRPNRCKYD